MTTIVDGSSCQYGLTNGFWVQKAKPRESKIVTKVAILAVVGAAVALSGGGASAQDAAKGEQVFKQCMTCHRIGPDILLTGDVRYPAKKD